MSDAESKWLNIYLNDHYAGSRGGLELARRVARAHRGTPAGEALERLAAEIAEDRQALASVLDALGVPVSRYKTASAWVAERAGRLKFNGRLLRRSPLSSVLELEAMVLGVQGKAAGWRTLRAVAASDSRLSAAGFDTSRFDELHARAQHQAETYEQLRTAAVEDVLVAGRSWQR